METDIDKIFSSTRIIPDEVYTNLPEMLYEVCRNFEPGRERDVVLTSTIGVASGLFPSVYGIYDNKRVHANLFLFICAPAASYKGSMNWTRKLGEGFHKELLERYNAEKKEYDETVNASKSDKNNTRETIEPPTRKLLFIPANSSSASVIQTLFQSNSSGIIFESEADTLSGTLKNDWGNYSDMLRKGFHHETISSNRKTNSEYYEVDMPKLSVVLSGTLAQVQRLIPNVEDGLFSRCLFYTYITPPTWRDVSPKNKVDMELHFQVIKEKYYKMLKAHTDKEIKFEFQEHHWEMLNECFQRWLIDYSTQISRDTRSVIVRLGLITFRIAMILSVVRNFEQNTTSSIIICDDCDFVAAMSLAETFKEHALTIFTHLPNGSSGGELRDKKFRKDFYDLLPVEFDRKTAVEIGVTQMKLAERTVDKYLKELFKINMLDQPKYGCYVKK